MGVLQTLADRGYAVVQEIAIVGAGLSGRLVALNLLRQHRSGVPVNIRLIDRRDWHDMGPAYSTDLEHLLLNVPAGKMGALADEPQHFLNWVRARGIAADDGAFLPRRLFRAYVFDLLQAALDRRPGNIGFEYLRGEVIDIDVDAGEAFLSLADGRTLAARSVILALGNCLPRQPAIPNQAALESERYARNAWDPRALDGLRPNDPVVFIGTGQTMVDLAIVLEQQGHKGRITALSRRGLLPMAHRQSVDWPSFFGELEGGTGLRHLFHRIRRQIALAQAQGVDPTAVIDALRPHTQAIWQALPEREKRRFMRHAFRYWEIIRSRIPPESEAVIERLRGRGQLAVVAGRITDMQDTGDSITVCYLPRGTTTKATVEAARVINCVGPEMDYRRAARPLLGNILKRGLIQPGPANIGMQATADGVVVGRDGRPSECLVTLGSTMRGVLWEVLAVPEIRVQAQRLALTLLQR